MAREVTAILTEMRGGDERAADRLLEAVYEELRDLASRRLKREKRGHTLQATALVHEAYLKLVDQSRVDWQGQTHFYAVAAQAMRRVLIDHGRKEKREKRGGGWRRVTLHDAFTLAEQGDLQAAALNEALKRLREVDERAVRIAELRLFAGMTEEQISAMLDVSVRTIQRDWKMAHAWLRRELSAGG